MTMPDYTEYFDAYASAYERSLAGPVDTAAIRSFFAESFLGVAIKGGVRCGSNDEKFEAALKEGYSMYRRLGTKSMHVERADAEPLCDGHDKVRVFYRAGHERKDGSSVSIPFEVTYLLQRREGKPKIFAYIADDEMSLYRQYGLVDERGNPA